MQLTPAEVSIPPSHGPSSRMTVGTSIRAACTPALTPDAPPPIITMEVFSLGTHEMASVAISHNIIP
jgi:hypothetical protein